MLSRAAAQSKLLNTLFVNSLSRFFNTPNSAPCAVLSGLGTHPKIVNSGAYMGDKIQRVLYRSGGLELCCVGGGLENNYCKETN